MFGYSALLRILRQGTSIELKGDPLETKNVEKVSQCQKILKGGPFSLLVRFCMLRLKSKKREGDPLL